MFCSNCGARLGEADRFCSTCGAPASSAPTEPRAARTPRRSDADKVAALITRIQSGRDDSAFSELFEQTKRYVAFLVRKSGVPESDVDDVLQNVFVSIYRDLPALRDPLAGLGWIKSLACHRAADFLRSRHNELLADEQTQDWLSGGGEGTAADEGSLASSFDLPGEAFEREEVCQVIRSFIEELPQDQQRLFLTRYMGGLSSSDIAQSWGLNANTVRSQLSRARKTLQERIDSYSEERGYKLYAMDGVALALLLFQGELDATQVNCTAAQVISRLSAPAPAPGAPSAAVPAPAGGQASTAVATAAKAGVPFAVKLAGMVVAATVLGGGASYGLWRANEAPRPQGQAQEEVGAQEGEKEPALDRQRVAALYVSTLDQVSSYDFFEGLEGMAPSGSYSYALADMNQDGIPELVVEADAGAGMSAVRVFSSNADGSKLLAPSGSLVTGAASAGGFRGGVLASSKADGLLYSILSSGSGSVSVYRAHIEGERLVQGDPVYQFNVASGDDGFSAESQPLEFTASADRAPLYAWAGMEAPETAQGSAPSGGSSLDAAIAAARGQGLSVYTGTLRIVSGYELLEIQRSQSAGMDLGSINAEEAFGSRALSSDYAILMLDGPTDVLAGNGDGMGQREATTTMICLLGENGDVSSWQAHDGQRVTVSIDPNRSWWPSDASLPLGVPRTMTGQLLS